MKPETDRQSNSQINKKNKFEFLFYDTTYLKYKNNLFHYITRKRRIAKLLKGTKFKNKLDIGSGISPILNPDNNTTFMDLSKEAVKFLRKKGINAVVSDITRIKSKNNRYDLVVCSEVLEHVPDYKKALKEMHRVLSPRGIMIVSVPIHMHYWSMDDEFVGHFRRFNPRLFVNEINKTGFKVVKVSYSGNPLERFITLTAVLLFGKNRTNMDFNFYKFINRIMSYTFQFIDMITPSSLSTIVIVEGRK